MDKQKSDRKNYGTAYYAMAFLAAFFFEFYWIMTNPYEYFMLLGIGIIMIIMGYLTIDSILKVKADADAKKNEQNEMMLKAQKAIYIATKKNAKDTEYRQTQSLKAVELMMNKMISSQQALLEDKKPADNDMSSLIDQLSASNAKLAKEVQSAITVNQLVKANADLVRNVKEALNASALNNTASTSDLNSYVNEAINSNPAPSVAPAPQVIPTPAAEPVPQVIPTPAAEPVPQVTPTPVVQPVVPDIAEFMTESETTSEPEFVVEPATSLEPEFMAEPETFTEPKVMAEPETSTEPEFVAASDVDSLNEFDMSEIASEESMDSQTMNDIETEINLASMEESEALEEITVPDEITPELDAVMSDISETEPEFASEEAANPFASQIDDSPNRQLTEEEIAALFASL